jgi:hypothetical protein
MAVSRDFWVVVVETSETEGADEQDVGKIIRKTADNQAAIALHLLFLNGLYLPDNLCPRYVQNARTEFNTDT